MVRRARGNWAAEQVFDGGLRIRDRGRTATHARAQIVYAQVDLDCRSGRVRHFPSELDLEHSTRLALCATDAQHPGERPGCPAKSDRIFLATNPVDGAMCISPVDCRALVAFLRSRGPALSRVG